MSHYNSSISNTDDEARETISIAEKAYKGFREFLGSPSSDYLRNHGLIAAAPGWWGIQFRLKVEDVDCTGVCVAHYNNQEDKYEISFDIKDGPAQDAKVSPGSFGETALWQDDRNLMGLYEKLYAKIKDLVRDRAYEKVQGRFSPLAW